jgi:CMP-N-acetylneuraminic acid synthetase
LKILGLILARGGSKRLPFKNIKLLGGRPLILWTIDIANQVNEISDLVLSTDSQEIADVCKSSKIKIPWLRPENLANDFSSSVDASLHCLNWYESRISKVDGLLLLQPTSPFRIIKSIEDGIKIFKESNLCTTVGVSEVEMNSEKYPCYRLSDKGYLVKHDQIIDGHLIQKQKLYRVNGSFYLISPEMLRCNQSFVHSKTLPLITNSRVEIIDIDTLDDFKHAEEVISKKLNVK